MAHKLFISQAGAGRVPCSYLALKQLTQQADGVTITAQREAKIGCKLPDYIIFRVIPQNEQVFFQGLRGLSFLQEFFRALGALSQLGSVQSSRNLRHAGSGGVNPHSILGATPTPSNAVTATRDYEGHSPRPFSRLKSRQCMDLEKPERWAGPHSGPICGQSLFHVNAFTKRKGVPAGS